MRDYQDKNLLELNDEVADRILTLATSAAADEDEDTLKVFSEAVLQARAMKDELNGEYRQILDNDMEMPPAIVNGLLANDPSGRSLWLVEYDLTRAARLLTQIRTSLSYQGMGALAYRGQDMAWKLQGVCNLLLEEVKMFRRHTAMPSGYLPRWNHEARNGCIKCPCEAAPELVVCVPCAENKPCEAVNEATTE